MLKKLPNSFRASMQAWVFLITLLTVSILFASQWHCPLGGLQAVGDLEFVEVDQRNLFKMEDVTDTHWNRQWGMRRSGFESAWSRLETYSFEPDPVTVAVLDTGVQLDHEDLTGRLWHNPGEIPGNGNSAWIRRERERERKTSKHLFVFFGSGKRNRGLVLPNLLDEWGIDDDGNGYVDDVHGWDFADGDADPSDDDGHGTHCAGVISAVKNGKGIVGASGSSSSIRIMVLRFLSSQGGRTSDAILALNYAVSMGAVISSNSWGWDLSCCGVMCYLPWQVVATVASLPQVGHHIVWPWKQLCRVHVKVDIYSLQLQGTWVAAPCLQHLKLCLGQLMIWATICPVQTDLNKWLLSL